MKKVEQNSHSDENIILDSNTEKDFDTKSDFKAWIKSHKKQLASIGLCTAAITGYVLGVKNKDTLMQLWTLIAEKAGEAAPKTISPSLNAEPLVSAAEPVVSFVAPAAPTRTYTLPKEPVHVEGFIRTMPPDWRHSEEKATEAFARGIQLLPHQTLVNSYTKYNDVA